MEDRDGDWQTWTSLFQAVCHRDSNFETVSSSLNFFHRSITTSSVFDTMSLLFFYFRNIYPSSDEAKFFCLYSMRRVQTQSFKVFWFVSSPTNTRPVACIWYSNIPRHRFKTSFIAHWHRQWPVGCIWYNNGPRHHLYLIQRTWFIACIWCSHLYVVQLLLVFDTVTSLSWASSQLASLWNALCMQRCQFVFLPLCLCRLPPSIPNRLSAPL